jgi:cytochrome c peroxidase
MGAAAIAAGVVAQAPPADPPAAPPPPSLKTVPVPSPDLTGIVNDHTALLKLGKALFWDMQVGSDGVQACGSCHFHAGADHRKINQINPGPNNALPFTAGAPNHTLTAADYPFHKLADINDRDSQVIRDSDDRAGSQGVVLVNFVDIVPGSAVDKTSPVTDPVFSINNLNVRRTEPRNSPTAVNAVFTQRNFWDGRANFFFNGASPFGDFDPNARVVVLSGTTPQAVRVSIPFSSLASQSLGPPLSNFEMSADKRNWPKIGKKMLSLAPLARQVVHPQDSVLGALSRSPYKGLSSSTTYKGLIQQAFASKYWASTQIILINPDGTFASFKAPPARSLYTSEFTQMEFNFSFFWGLAIEEYEKTLVSDNTPFDQYQEGTTGALTAQQVTGMGLFFDKGKCNACHQEATFTSAALIHIQDENIVERMLVNNQPRLYDTGFYNIGVRKTFEDLGVGGTDPFGNPLSFSRLLIRDGSIPGFPIHDACLFDIDPCTQPGPNDIAAVDGSFKTATLRNSELTGPYFHTGGELNLRSVVDHYNRGGNFANDELHPDITQLDLTDAEKDAIVSFLLALTDDRVRFERAPFDHPQICVPNGHVIQADPAHPNQAKDTFVNIVGSGKFGNTLPLQTFEELVAGTSTGREHTLNTSCTPN